MRAHPVCPTCTCEGLPFEAWFPATVDMEIGSWRHATLIEARVRHVRTGQFTVDIDRQVDVTIPDGVKGTVHGSIRGPHGAEIIAFPHRWPVLAGDTVRP